MKALLAPQLGDRELTDEEVAGFSAELFGEHDDKISFDEYVCALHGASWIEVINKDEAIDTSGLENRVRWEGIFTKAAEGEVSDGQAGMNKAEFRRVKRLIRARNATSRLPEGQRIIDQVFEEIDLNNDNLIQKDEFFKMIEKWQSMLPTSGGQTMEDSILTALERSSKKSDFFIMDDRHSKLDTEEMDLVKYIFKRIDHDNSGAISYKEFLAFRNEFYFTTDAASVADTVFSADKNADDKLSEDEFITVFMQFKTSLAKNHLGGKFFKEHLTDLATDHWDAANPEADPPPVQAVYDRPNGATWHCIGGQMAVAELTEDRVEAREAKTAEREAKKSKMGNKVKKRDDFNFSRVFAARQNGYKGVVR